MPLKMRRVISWLPFMRGFLSGALCTMLLCNIVVIPRNHSEPKTNSILLSTSPLPSPPLKEVTGSTDPTKFLIDRLYSKVDILSSRLDRLEMLPQDDWHRKDETTDGAKSVTERPKSNISPISKSIIKIDLVPTTLPKTDPPSSVPRDWPVWWFAPFFDGSGYATEAASLILGLIRTGTIPEKNVWIGVTEPDCKSSLHPEGKMPIDDINILKAARERGNLKEKSIVVCHSLPPFWTPEYGRPKWISCQPCPPRDYDAAAVIGRAMVETDKYDHSFVDNCNGMDEVWVPSEFSRKILEASGVNASKLHIVPISVNTTQFNPTITKPLSLPFGTLAIGEKLKARMSEEDLKQMRIEEAEHISTLEIKKLLAEMTAAGKTGNKQLGNILEGAKKRISDAQAARLSGHDKSQSGPPFVFLSTFKWESRKGWDILLTAYLQEFTHEDNVELYIVTKKNGDNSMVQAVKDFARQDLKMSEQQIKDSGPILYKSIDCYVMPSRGEGWGLPVTEAMAMAKPVIVTGWSGLADIVDDSVGYLINYTLTKVPENDLFWIGGQWANADIPHLRKLMRHVASNPKEAKDKGLEARKRVDLKYSPTAVSAVLAKEFNRVKSLLPATVT